MDWTEEAATDGQLSAIRGFGQEPDHPLRQGEPAHLIGNQDAEASTEGAKADGGGRASGKPSADLLRVAVEDARKASPGGPVGNPEEDQCGQASTIARRQEFWIDTCRDPTQMQARSEHVLDLYRRCGCRFVAPTREQVQEVLNALDTALANWDRDHPELFYQTLEINFPELRRHL